MRTAPLLAAALVVALAAAPPARAQDGRVGTVVSVRNQVLGTPPGGSAVPLAAGDGLVLRQEVRTLADAAARMALGEEGNLSLGAETRIVLDEIVLGRAGGGRSRLSLLLGSLRLKLNELFHGELEVETPTAVIGVKGTDFRVEVYEGVTVVTVFEGTVTFLGKLAGKAVEVAAGQRSVVQGGHPPTQPAKADLTSEPEPGVEGETPRSEEPEKGREPERGKPGEKTRQPERQPGEETRQPEEPREPAPEAAGPPHLEGCAPFGQAGEAVCACGRFPGGSAAALTLDGRPLEVLSASPGRVDLLLPSDLEPGSHVLAGEPQAGFSRADRCTLGVQVVEVSYDPPLRQGRASRLLLQVHGTREAVKIRVENLSPRVIRVKGGADQTVTTRGGKKNLARLRVQTLADGLARIRVRIRGLAGCPCGGK
jgi:FecR protein